MLCFTFQPALSCVQLWPDFSHGFTPLSKVVMSVCSFKLEGREFHSRDPLTSKEKFDSPKDVLHFGSS